MCQRRDPFADEQTRPGVFEELDANELSAVRDWMHGRFPNLVPYTNSSGPTLDQDYVAAIERMYDNKPDVLGYLDENKAQPGRFAKVCHRKWVRTTDT